MICFFLKKKKKKQNLIEFVFEKLGSKQDYLSLKKFGILKLCEFRLFHALTC
jgi:hypothetical protein